MHTLICCSDVATRKHCSEVLEHSASINDILQNLAVPNIGATRVIQLLGSQSDNICAWFTAQVAVLRELLQKARQENTALQITVKITHENVRINAFTPLEIFDKHITCRLM